MKRIKVFVIILAVVMLIASIWFIIISKNSKGRESGMTMTVTVGEKKFEAVLQDNKAVDEFTEMMRKAPVTIKMSDYSGFEKVGLLGRSLSANDKQMRTKAGDIVLYNENNIVIFYGSHSWSYTKLGGITDLTGWEDALGIGDVTVTFSIEQK